MGTDRAIIKTKSTCDFKGVTYQMGKEYTVDLAVAKALGGLCEILKIEKAVIPTVEDVKVGLKKKAKVYKASKKAMMTGTEEAVETK